MTTQVLQSQSHFPSPSSSSASTSTSTSTSIPLIHNDVPHHQHYYSPNCPSSVGVQVEEQEQEQEQEQEDQEEGGRGRERDEEREGDQLSLLTLLVTIFRKSLVVGGCSSKRETGFCSRMDIGLPTNVRHVAHVTFDRFDGFLGLPVEFEPEVPRRPPSASASVFGVSTESMQLSFDSRGNSVPTILLLMQRRLYSQGGLKAEGIFRINGENSQEEYIRDQLNRGLVPDGVDVHCLAGLIKAWFRELPKGILDSLPPEQVMQSHSEEECAQLVRTLPPTEAALLDWAINLMADVAQLEHLNKMNARNVAMVFAPNMTQMSDPLTALMYAVQVMNFLKMLIIKTLQEREDSVVENAPCQTEPADENGHDGSSRSVFLDEAKERNEGEEREFSAKEPSLESPSNSTQDGSSITENGEPNFLSSIENIIPDQNGASTDTCNHHEVSSQVKPLTDESEENDINGANEVADQDIIFKARTGQSSNTNFKKGLKKAHERAVVRAKGFAQKNKGTNVVSRINSRSERIEAWR